MLHRKIVVAALLSGLLLLPGSAQARTTGHPACGTQIAAHAVAFTRADCVVAIKLLTQYERLAQKFGLKPSPKRIKELDRKRDSGTISTNDLPATLRRKFPGYFKGWSLRDIARHCFVAYGIGREWTGFI